MICDYEKLYYIKKNIKYEKLHRKVKIICDTCGKIYEGNLYTNKNSIKHNCKSCTAIINGKKQSKNKGKAQLNNKTHKIYWLNKGYTEEEATFEIKKLHKISKEYWLNKGYTEEEAIKIANITACKRNSMCKEYWLNKGYTEEEAIKIAKSKIPERCMNFGSYITKENKNILRKEYWLNKGYTEEEAVFTIKKIQHKRFKHLTHSDYVNNGKKASITYKNKINYKDIIKTISDKMKNNIYKSPIFKEYWLNKGYTEEEAIKKVLNIKQNNIHNASKIEIKCLNELSEYLNIDIIRNKYLRYNNKNYAPDGRYKNFLIEFNGTNVHMDKRFYKEGDINCFKKLYEDIHMHDDERYLQLSNKYYIIIIWEYDYKRNKDNVFNKIKEIINENFENRGLWDSSSI